MKEVKMAGTNGKIGGSYAEIQSGLKQPLSDEYLATRQQKGTTLTFIPWHKAADLGDELAPGWQTETKVVDMGTAVSVLIRIGIPTSDLGVVWREGEGWENKDTSSYGDPSSNAASMAFRRAWAKHGLGRYLYNKDKTEAEGEGNSSIRMWFGDYKGKDYTDISIPVKALQWAADHTDDSKYPQQKDKILAEIARRQGQIGGVPPVTGGKIGPQDILSLKNLGTKNGVEWAEIKGLAQQHFGQADPSKLASGDFDTLKVLVEAS